MNNPYVQVALTYIRRPLATWQGRVMSLSLIPIFLMVFVVGMIRNQHYFSVIQLFPLAVVLPFLAMHMMEPFVGPRADLMPNFKQVHLTIAAIVTTLFVVVLPATISALLGWHSVGLVALFTLLFGLLLRPPSMTIAVVLAGLYIITFKSSAATGLYEIIIGQRELLAICIFGLGTLLILRTGFQIAQLDEDMPGYRANIMMNALWRQKTGQPLPIAEGSFQSRQIDEQIMRCIVHARQASAKSWSRICRWHVGMTFGRSLIPVVLVQAIVIHSYSWSVALIGWPEGVNGALPFWFVTFLPVAVVLSAFQQAFKDGRGLLLPIERNSYILQVGAAAALSQLQVWACGAVVLAIWWQVSAPVVLPLPLLGQCLAFSAAIQVLAFGIMAWVSRWRSKAELGGILCLTIWLQFITIQFSQTAVIVISSIVVALGPLIAYDAYRRWLVADFD